MNPTFKITTTDSGIKKEKLVFLMSLDMISFIILDVLNNCTELQSYHLPTPNSIESTAALLNDIVSSQHLYKADFEKVCFIYSFPTVLIVPSQFSSDKDKKEMLELVFGEQQDSTIHTDVDLSLNRHTIYSIPEQVSAVTEYLFSAHEVKHLFSLLPKLKGLNGNQLYCVFCNSFFTAMLVKSGKLQAVQVYPFKSPEDVCYHLLHLCESFEMGVDNLTVRLSGMVSENSNLFQELSKYFLNLQLESLPPGIHYQHSVNDYPPHYFSHLFAVSECV